jgi:hypothetical protein
VVVAVTGRKYVIGCVWGAHRTLYEKLGDDAAPSYEWCEAEWLRAPEGALPPVGDKRLPDELVKYLEAAWQDHGQPTLF